MIWMDSGGTICSLSMSLPAQVPACRAVRPQLSVVRVPHAFALRVALRSFNL